MTFSIVEACRICLLLLASYSCINVVKSFICDSNASTREWAGVEETMPKKM